MKTILIKIMIILVIIRLDILSQTFTIRSQPIPIHIIEAPPDSINPILNIKLPKVMKGFPYYIQDSVFSIEGNLEDNSGNVYLTVNHKKIGKFTNGSFSTPVPLKYGENEIEVEISDKMNNSTLSRFIVFQDPKADITPPLIQIEEPNIFEERGIKVVKKIAPTDSIITLKGKISDQSGVMQLLINGFKIDSLAGGEFTYRLDYNTTDSIEIFAADYYGNISELSLYKTSKEIEQLDEIFSGINFYALIIADEQYDDKKIINLDYPVSDAQKLSDVLSKKYSFKPENITLLVNPDRRDILKSFQELRAKLTEDDNLLIFYAGHGYYDSEIDQGYWLPSDAEQDDKSNWISNSNIRDLIRGINTQHTLLISDACFAGAIFDSRSVMDEAPKSIQELYKYRSRKAMTSGVLNTVPDKSVFVESLFKRLWENKAKYLPAQNLFLLLREFVINNSVTEQRPEYKPIRLAEDEGIGDFIFIQK